MDGVLVGLKDDFNNFTFYEEVSACSSVHHQDPKSRVHMHNSINSVIHVHDDGVTWAHSFENIGYVLLKTVEIEIISKGLYQKMITSAGGLVVGVFAFICYHVLTARIDRMEQRLNEAQEEYFDLQFKQNS